MCHLFHHATGSSRKQERNHPVGSSDPGRAPINVAFAILLCVFVQGTGIARTWHVPGDAETIQGGINAASAGDDILVAAGHYVEWNIAMKGDIWVHSEQGPEATIVDPDEIGVGFTCDNLNQISTIEGFTIVNGRAESEWDLARGGGIRCNWSPLIVRDCIISECYAPLYGGGIYAFMADLDVERCKIVHCVALQAGGGVTALTDNIVRIVDTEIQNNEASGDAGIQGYARELTILRCVISGNVALYGDAGGIYCASPAFTIRDCLIARNAAWEFADGNGIQIYEGAGTIEGCTLGRNMSDNPGGCISVMGADVSIARTIVAFNQSRAFFCTPGSHVGIECCDVYGNTEGDALCGEDVGGNFSADPLFCSWAQGDYTLDFHSPCLPGNHPNGVECGLIGALGLGCGAPPPTGACCFADGSCVVLEQQMCEEPGGSYQGDGSTCEPNPCQPTPIESTTWGRIKSSFR